jgi:hypothetical protein
VGGRFDWKAPLVGTPLGCVQIQTTAQHKTEAHPRKVNVGRRLGDPPRVKCSADSQELLDDAWCGLVAG